MPIPFSQSMRALQADQFRRPAVLLILGMLMLAAWGGWLMLARVSVYVVTEAARLEVDQAAHVVEAPVRGQLVSADVTLGQTVEAGALLFTLDAEAERLQLAEAHANRTALEAQLVALHREHGAGSEALHQAHQAGSVSLEEAQIEYREAVADARLAESEVARMRQLYEKQLLSEAEYEHLASEARQKQAVSETRQKHLQHLDLIQQQEASDRRARLDQLRREMARLEGEIATTTAFIKRLAHEIEERQVRAPVAGHVGELAEVRVGAFVEAGDRLGAIVPEGQLRAVAYFTPSDAVGRLAAGQPALLRLDGFPWAQYGSVAATVERVASEVQAGRVRVELRVEPASAPRIPLQHGLPGRLEVQVEHTSPATLVLRHAGKIMQGPPRS